MNHRHTMTTYPQIAFSKEAMEDDGWEYTMHVSFVEIYCEKIKVSQ